MRRLVRRRGPGLGAPAAWVLGGGAARGAAQVGTIRALFEHGIRPSAIFGTSVGALDGAVIAARPNLDGVDMLERLWLSDTAREVFRVHSFGLLVSRLAGRLGLLSPLPVQKLILEFQSATGCRDFEDLEIPLRVVTTDLREGASIVVGSGALAPALMASASIPGVFPPVALDGRLCSDGGIVDNVPISQAVRGYGRILAIGLMAATPLKEVPASWKGLVARTLQLSLHHRLLSDFERLRNSARIVVICPVTPPEAAWDMGKQHTASLMKRSFRAASRFLDAAGDSLFDRSAIHYLDVASGKPASARTVWLADAV